MKCLGRTRIAMIAMKQHLSLLRLYCCSLYDLAVEAPVQPPGHRRPGCPVAWVHLRVRRAVGSARAERAVESARAEGRWKYRSGISGHTSALPSCTGALPAPRITVSVGQ
jgi:hypothetical protein